MIITNLGSRRLLRHIRYTRSLKPGAIAYNIRYIAHRPRVHLAPLHCTRPGRLLMLLPDHNNKPSAALKIYETRPLATNTQASSVLVTSLYTRTR